MGYARCPIQHFEGFFKNGLNEEDIQLFLQQYNSDFVRIEKLTGI